MFQKTIIFYRLTDNELKKPGLTALSKHSIVTKINAVEVERSLVGLLDFKSSGRREKRLRWVRFPCTSATYKMFK